MINAEMVELIPAYDLFDDDPIPLTPTTALPDFPSKDLPAAIRGMVEAFSVAPQPAPPRGGPPPLPA